MINYYGIFLTYLDKKLKIDARYFVSGGFWLSAGQVCTMIFGIITTALLANYLDEIDYGIYKYLLVLASLCTVASLTGVGQAILQTSAKGFGGFYNDHFGLIIRYNFLITLTAGFGAAYYWINDNTTLATGCILIALIQPLIQTFLHIIPQLRGEQKFKLTTQILTIRSIFVSSALLATLYFTTNILWLLVVSLLSQLSINLITYLTVQRKYPPTPLEVSRQYVAYAKHTSVRNVIDGLTSKADSLIIFTRLGAAELALYSIAIIIPDQIKGSLKNLSSLLLPKYAKVTDAKILVATLPLRTLQLFIVLALVSLVYILTAPYVYQILFPKYVDAVIFSQIAALGFPTFVSILPKSILETQTASASLYKINIVSAVIQLTLVFTGVVLLGVLGVIIASVVRKYITAMMFYILTFSLARS